MQPTTKTVAKFLRIAGEMLEIVTESELKELISKMPRKPQLVRPQSVRLVKAPLSADEISRLAGDLERASSRAIAMQLLTDSGLGRQDLVALGKRKSAHITKQDQVGHIREKLVEAFIGAKLSSNAIRGE